MSEEMWKNWQQQRTNQFQIEDTQEYFDEDLGVRAQGRAKNLFYFLFFYFPHFIG